MVGDGTRGAATGGADSSFSIITLSFHGVALLYTAGTNSVLAEGFEIMRMIFDLEHSTIEPLAASSRRTGSGAATPARSADSTTAA